MDFVKVPKRQDKNKFKNDQEFRKAGKGVRAKEKNIELSKNKIKK
jgi:hypothetical protein